jgi:hypothetical protein
MHSVARDVYGAINGSATPKPKKTIKVHGEASRIRRDVTEGMASAFGLCLTELDVLIGFTLFIRMP